MRRWGGEVGQCRSPSVRIWASLTGPAIFIGVLGHHLPELMPYAARCKLMTYVEPLVALSELVSKENIKSNTNINNNNNIILRSLRLQHGRKSHECCYVNIIL